MDFCSVDIAALLLAPMAVMVAAAEMSHSRAVASHVHWVAALHVASTSAAETGEEGTAPPVVPLMLEPL